MRALLLILGNHALANRVNAIKPMATYDSGARYDSGVRYDEVSAVTTKPKKMSKPKLELKSKNDTEVLAFARAHITAMTGNPNFATPLPPAPAMLALADGYEAGLNDWLAKNQAAQAARSAKDDLRELLEQGLTQRANYVEIDSGGDETQILSAGFSVRAQAAPPSAVGQPANLRAAMGAMTGTIEVAWDTVKGAKSYILDCRTHGATPGPWAQVKILTAPKYAVTGLTPGIEYSFRVRAVGAAGEGPWSDEAVKMAPA
jgi:hypothetical protein